MRKLQTDMALDIYTSNNYGYQDTVYISIYHNYLA